MRLCFAAMLVSFTLVASPASAQGPHVSLFRAEGDAPLTISLAAREGHDPHLYFGPAYALPCSLELSGTWVVRPGDEHGEARGRSFDDIDGFGGGEYVVRFESRRSVRELGIAGVVLGAVAGVATAVSALVMFFDAVAHASAALLTSVLGGMPEAHDEPWWVLAPLAISAVVLLVSGAIGLSQRDVSELRRVGPGPSGSWRAARE